MISFSPFGFFPLVIYAFQISRKIGRFKTPREKEKQNKTKKQKQKQKTTRAAGVKNDKDMVLILCHFAKYFRFFPLLLSKLHHILKQNQQFLVPNS